MQITNTTLELINNKYLQVEQYQPTKRQPNPPTLPPYDKEYSVPLQYKLPYRHTISQRIKSKKVLKLSYVHPH